MDTATTVKNFIDEVKKKRADSRFKSILSQSTKEDIIKWLDDSNNDLLHHSIIQNSPEAVECLLSNGYFVEPHQPEVNPYAHLAALLGFRTVLNILITYRLSDMRPMNTLIYPKTKTECDFKHSEKVTPLDVSAKAGHSHCVHLILTQCIIKENPNYAKSGYVSLATIANSPIAVEVMLKEKNPKSDILEATDIAVHGAKPVCLNLLLSTGIDTRSVFHGVNFYHTLYSFASAQSFGKEGYARLPDVTSVLIKHNFDVKAKEPTNTYPLYSLIKNSLCLDNYTWTQYYLKCVQLLLRAGADPNFDEVKHERLLMKRGVKSVVGRPAYSSAMHCLLDTVESYADTLDSKSLAAKFVIECANILCKKEANVNQIGRVGVTNPTLGTVLHQFAKSSVQIGVDLDILKFLLRQGANVDAVVKGRYMLNTYANSLFSKIKETPAHLPQTDYMKEVKRMLWVCEYMSRTALKETLKVFRNDHCHNPPPQIKTYVGVISKEIEYHSKHIKPLKNLSAEFLWRICQRNANLVHKLPISAKYKTEILPIT